ncbi:MAG: lactate racemase domain-containing protein [candidate division Zixibacteria bacterium]|nr:lactate racemase domain-containing protein [candidate division Zixibacteria bacterium]
MNVDIRYGSGILSIPVPSNSTVDFIGKQDGLQFPVVGERAFKTAFLQSDGPSYLSHESPLVVVNDGFRNTPTSIVLEWLKNLAPGFLKRARFLISTGTHTPPTLLHLQSIFGPLYEDIKDRVFIHDCRTSDMVLVGQDYFKHNFYINSLAASADKTIIVGSVEPHYFAGFTGGRKSFFPGLTDFATIERNHNLANSMEARPLRLKGNPVAEHLQSLMESFRSSNVLSIQAVIDSNEQMVGCFVNDMLASFSQAVDLALEVYAHEVSKPYDLVICELYPPLDANLYQAQKGLENAQAGVVDGGNIIVAAACQEGIGSEHFFNLALQWDKERNQARDGISRFGSHKLSRVNLLSRRIGIYLHSDLDDDIVRQVFYEPIHDITAFISALSENKKLRIAVVRNAGHTVLRVD